jgi:hypothetical protein
LNFESYTSLQKRKFVGLPDLSTFRKKEKKKKKTKRKRRKDTTSEESCLAKEVLDFVPLYIVFDLALLLHWRMPCVAGYTRHNIRLWSHFRDVETCYHCRIKRNLRTALLQNLHLS